MNKLGVALNEQNEGIWPTAANYIVFVDSLYKRTCYI